jgi:methionyl-tRNA formyltransferase
MAQISVVFCGTSAFAVPSLEALARDLAFHIDLVITQPDKPVGRKHIVTPPPVKIAAQKLCLPVWQPENSNTDFSRRPQSSVPHPDCLVGVAYGQILSDEILAWPRIATVNLHASLLPRWRGASPIQHAILTGDAETGVNVQRIIRELDAGPILAQERVSIEERETALHLTEHLANL